MDAAIDATMNATMDEGRRREENSECSGLLNGQF